MFTWEFNDPLEGLDLLVTLPEEAVTALVAFMDALVCDPWGLAGREPGVKNMPSYHFGPGNAGLVAVHIRDEERELLITQVLWRG